MRKVRSFTRHSIKSLKEIFPATLMHGFIQVCVVEIAERNAANSGVLTTLCCCLRRVFQSKTCSPPPKKKNFNAIISFRSFNKKK